MIDSAPLNPPDITKKIINYLADDSTRKTEVAFFGGTFTRMSRDEMLEYLLPVQPFIREKSISQIRISTRPDALDESIADFLAKHNVRTVCLGIESIFEDVLYHSRRYYNLDIIEKSLNLLSERGIGTVLQIMLGLPLDTREKSMKTLSWASGKNVSGVRICPTLILKNTYLESLYRQNKYSLWEERVFYDLLEYGLLAFFKSRIPVLRIGLCIDSSIRKNYVAGLLHHSLGDYIEYRSFFRILAQKFGTADSGTNIELQPELKKFINGYGGENRQRLISQFGISSISFAEEGISEKEIVSMALEMPLKDIISEYSKTGNYERD